MGNRMRVATGSSTLEIANSPTTPKIVAIMSCIPRRHLFIGLRGALCGVPIYRENASD